MVKRDWSIRAMRGRARRARLAAPFALRGRLAGGRGEELVDRAGDVACNRTLVAVRVQHDEPSGLGRREAQVAVAHALVEGAIVEVEAVPAVVALAPRAEARERHLDRRVEEERALRPQPADREARDRAQPLEIRAEPVALVRERRVEEAVGEDDLPRGERRPEDVADVLRARGGEEERLRLRTEREAARVKQHLADPLPERRAAGLARHEHVAPAAGERLREPRRLERFPQALAALEREEEPPAHRYMCTRR